MFLGMEEVFGGRAVERGTRGDGRCLRCASFALVSPSEERVRMIVIVADGVQGHAEDGKREVDWMKEGPR